MPLKIRKQDDADKNQDDECDICTNACVAADFDSFRQYESHMRRHIRPLVVRVKRIKFDELEPASTTRKNVFRFRGDGSSACSQNNRSGVGGGDSNDCENVNGQPYTNGLEHLPSAGKFDDRGDDSFDKKYERDDDIDDDVVDCIELCSPIVCDSESDNDVPLSKLVSPPSLAGGKYDKGSRKSNSSVFEKRPTTPVAAPLASCNGDIIDLSELDDQSPAKPQPSTYSTAAVRVKRAQPPCPSVTDPESPDVVTIKISRRRRRRQIKGDKLLRISLTPSISRDRIIDETCSSSSLDGTRPLVNGDSTTTTLCNGEDRSELRISCVPCVPADKATKVVRRRDSSDDVVFVSAFTEPTKTPPPPRLPPTQSSAERERCKHKGCDSPQMRVSLVSCLPKGGGRNSGSPSTEIADKKLRRQFGAKDFQIRLTNHVSLRVDCVYQVVCHDVDPLLLEPTTLLDGEAAVADDRGVPYYYAAAIAAGASSEEDDCMIVEADSAGFAHLRDDYTSQTSAVPLAVDPFVAEQRVPPALAYDPLHTAQTTVSYASCSQTVTSTSSILLSAETRDMLRLFGAGHFMLGALPSTSHFQPPQSTLRKKQTPFPRHRNLLKPPPIVDGAPKPRKRSVAGQSRKGSGGGKQRRLEHQPQFSHAQQRKKLQQQLQHRQVQQQLQQQQQQLQQQLVQHRQQLQQQQQQQQQNRRRSPNSEDVIAAINDVIVKFAMPAVATASSTAAGAAAPDANPVNVVAVAAAEDKNNAAAARRPSPPKPSSPSSSSSKLQPHQFQQLFQRHCQQLLLQTLTHQNLTAAEAVATLEKRNAQMVDKIVNRNQSPSVWTRQNLSPQPPPSATNNANRLQGSNCAVATVTRTPLAVCQPPYTNVAALSGRGMKRKRNSSLVTTAGTWAVGVGDSGGGGGGGDGTPRANAAVAGGETTTAFINGSPTMTVRLDDNANGDGDNVISLISDSDDENGGETIENMADFMEVVEMD